MGGDILLRDKAFLPGSLLSAKLVENQRKGLFSMNQMDPLSLMGAVFFDEKRKTMGNRSNIPVGLKEFFNTCPAPCFGIHTPHILKEEALTHLSRILEPLFIVRKHLCTRLGTPPVQFFGATLRQNDSLGPMDPFHVLRTEWSIPQDYLSVCIKTGVKRNDHGSPAPLAFPCASFPAKAAPNLRSI